MIQLIGYRRMQGTSKRTGKPYNGYMLYCEEDHVPQDVCGNICFEKYADVNILSNEPYVGAEVRFHFDFRGYLTQVEII